MMSFYKQQAMSRNVGKITDGLFMLIQANNFCLNKSELELIKNCCRDKRVAGWLFAYKVYAAPRKSRNSILIKNLKNPNPRIREQVCDIVGDESIKELRDCLRGLFNDQIGYVSEAARYNYDEMF